MKKIFSSEFGKGALTLFVMINVFNFFNFLFHFFMGRMLGPADYGILAVLMSIVFLYGIPSESVQNLISRHVSKFNIKKEGAKINFLTQKSLKKSFKISTIIFITSIPVSFILSEFLKINFWLIILTNSLAFAAISIPIIRGVLQGRKKFQTLGWSLILDAGIKLFVAISLVLIGFRIFGAILGVLIGAFAALVFSLFFNRDISKIKPKETKFKGIYLESFHYFIAMIVILIAFNIDVILAKRFFSPIEAGQYAALAILGRIIFLGTLSIGKAMFPLTSESHDNKKDSFKLFKKAFFVVFALCLLGVLFYAIFPELIIIILYGKLYLEVASLLIYSGIALSFLALGNLILFYSLSTTGLKRSYYLFIFLVIEIILLLAFHDSLLEYILAFMASSILLFIGTLFFIKKNQQK